MDQPALKTFAEDIRKECTLNLLKEQWGNLWEQVARFHIEREFCKFLEEYDFYDLDRARDIIAEGP